MPEDLQPFVDLLPAQGVMPYEEWRQSAVSSGLRLGNRNFQTLRKQRLIATSFDDNGQLVIQRGEGAS